MADQTYAPIPHPRAPAKSGAQSSKRCVIDGREAVTALRIIKEAIEDPMRILIDL